MGRAKQTPPTEDFPYAGGKQYFAVSSGSSTWVCLCLALATFMAYWAVARNGFVNYDDPEYVSANPHVQAGLTRASIVWAFTSGHASNWHPVTWLSHMLDCQLFGLRPGPAHVVNLALHVANTLILFLLLERMTGARWRSAAVAALFGLHPLHVESVAWISERKDVLSALFFLLTLAAYVRYTGVPKLATDGPGAAPSSRGMAVRKPKPTGARAAKRVAAELDSSRRPSSGSPLFFYVCALMAFAFGLMSKPMLVTVPFLLLLLDYWPLGRFVSAGGVSEMDASGVWQRLVVEKIPFFVLAVASCIVTFFVQRQGGAVSTSISLTARIANALVSYTRYLGKTLYPIDLSVLYPHPGFWPWWQVGLCATLLLAISLAAFWVARTQPELLMGWLWFLGALVPVIGIVQVGIQSMADRYTYIPHIGMFIGVVWGLQGALGAAVSRHSRWPAGVFSLVLLLCALLTARQVGFWHDSHALFQNAVRVTRNNYLAYNNLGFFLSKEGKTTEAMTYYAKSLEINPRYEDALNNMGYALAGLKRYPEAIGYYQQALRIRPDNVEVLNNLGNALSELGKINDAIVEYALALKRNPEHADAHNNLGIALAMQGKMDEAIGHFRQAIRFKPDYASAHSNLGNALAAQHRLAEAIQEYSTSLALNPKDPQAHNNLANALAEQGALDEAIPHYGIALDLNSNNPEAHFNLGMALERKGRKEEAVGHFQEAVRLKPDYGEARSRLDSLSSSNRALLSR